MAFENYLWKALSFEKFCNFFLSPAQRAYPPLGHDEVLVNLFNTKLPIGPRAAESVDAVCGQERAVKSGRNNGAQS